MSYSKEEELMEHMLKYVMCVCPECECITDIADMTKEHGYAGDIRDELDECTDPD